MPERLDSGADHSPRRSLIDGVPVWFSPTAAAPVEPGHTLHRLASRLRTLTATGLPDKFISRAAWGARAPRAVHTSITPANGGIALHYEGPDMGGKGPAVWAHSACPGMVRGIQAFHMNTRGWDDIAYTAVVCPHGYVFEGRGVGHRTAAQGTNAGNQNYYALCGMWGEGDTFTDAAKVGFDQGIQWLRRKGAGADVQPHSHFHATSCPGTLVSAWIHAGRPLPAPPQPPAPKPAPVPTPTPQPVPKPVPVPTPKPPVVKAPPFPLPKGWYFGPRTGPKESVSGYFSHAADLKAFQVRLRQMGWNVTANGRFNLGHDEVVLKAFQAQMRLAKDARVGKETWAAAWTAAAKKKN